MSDIRRASRFADARPVARPRRFDADRRNSLLAIAALAIMVSGALAWSATKVRLEGATRREAGSMCLAGTAPPVANLVLVDATDPLARNSGPRFRALMSKVREATPKNGRLTVATFDGDLGHPLQVRFDACSPGRGRDANALVEGPRAAERRYREGFQKALDGVSRALADKTSADASPIAEQITRAANDPAVPWRGERRVLTLLTDGLQNTPGMSPYGGDRFALPPAPAGLLTGVTVDYIELANPRSSARQTPAVRQAWAKWLADAGAEVRMFAPGFPPPA